MAIDRFALNSVAFADSEIAPFDTQFIKVVLRTEYGEAIHFVMFEWTANSMSMDTDLNHGTHRTRVQSHKSFLYIRLVGRSLR
jgi:hypothetical protein